MNFLIQIYVEGNIAAGKSTFLEYVKGKYAELGLISVRDEPLDLWTNLNGVNVLDLFYKETKKYALVMQV